MNRNLREAVTTGLVQFFYRPARAIRGKVQSIGSYARAFGFTGNSWIRGYKLPNCLIYFGIAPGDDLLCTAVLRELRKRGGGSIWMISNYPELFAGNSDATRVVPDGYDYESIARLWRCGYRPLEYAPFDLDDRSKPPCRHIIAKLCEAAGIVGAVDIKPYLQLTEVEKANGEWAKGRIVIQSSGLAAKHPMINKQWYAERYQSVVNALLNECEVVQLGGAIDPELYGVRDLRGATSIRQSAAILYHASLYIGGVGFLMHLARAVECPSVIVFGGREAPWQSGYVCNANLYTAVPCAPCWRWNRCDINRQCMQAISAEDVVNASRKLLAKPRNQLATETVLIS